MVLQEGLLLTSIGFLLGMAFSQIGLLLKPDYPKFKMDQVVNLNGKLKLNRDDIYQCNIHIGRG